MEGGGDPAEAAGRRVVFAPGAVPERPAVRLRVGVRVGVGTPADRGMERLGPGLNGEPEHEEDAHAAAPAQAARSRPAGP